MSLNPFRWCRAPLLVLGVSLLPGCGDLSPPIAETPPPPVTVSQPVVRQVVTHDDYEGHIAAAERVEVRARVRGHLTKVNFKAGQTVKEGDLLYEIDPRPYKASLDGAEAVVKAAEASLQLANAEYNREAGLAQQKATSQRELDVWQAKQAVAKAEVLKAKAGTEDAKLNFDFTKIYAPITGKISRTQVDVGNLVNAGGGDTLLTTLVSTEPMYVYFNVDERALIRYRRAYRKEVEQKDKPVSVKALQIPVYVALEGEEGYPHKGTIDFVDNQVNPGTGTFQVRGVLPSEPLVYEDGMRARVRIPVGAPYEAVLVTERAFGTDQGRKYVYVVNAQNAVERRDVVPGRLDGGLQVVQEGLRPGDWVIVNGIQRVRDGMTVQPKQVPMPGAK